MIISENGQAGEECLWESGQRSVTCARPGTWEQQPPASPRMAG